MSWMKTSKPKLNPNKMEDLLFVGSQVWNLSRRYVLHGVEAPPHPEGASTQVGVLQNLSLSLAHVRSVALSPWGQL